MRGQVSVQLEAEIGLVALIHMCKSSVHMYMRALMVAVSA